MATFAPQPSEFEYPYWDTRVAYDASLEAAINANETAADAAQSTADTALTNAATAQATADAALPVHLPPASGTDLNTLTAVGVHPVPWLTGTLVLNFPIASTAGIVEVLPYDGVKLIQRFTPTTGTSATRGTWTRRRTDTSTWGEWSFQPTQRIDNTAGRAIYTWDETANREQFIYGDTGTRNITALVSAIDPIAAGTVLLFRRGGDVFLELQGVRFVTDSASATHTLAGLLPTGFRPRGTVRLRGPYGDGFVAPGVGGDLSIVTGISGSVYSLFQWSTYDNWPTTLPGTAVGTIPHN